MGISLTNTHYNPTVVSDSVVCNIDFANIKNYNAATLEAICAYTGLSLTTNNTSYVTVADGYATFDRAASAPTIPEKNVAGGTIRTNGLNSSSYSSARYENFYYNDHTFEVLFRINTATPSNYDATETSSHIAGHRGYNNGFSINSSGSTVNYSVWHGTFRSNTMVSWSVTNEVPVGKWNHLAVTRSGSTWTRYLNGIPLSSATDNPAVNLSTGGTLGDIGLGATVVTGSNFQYYSKTSIAFIRMYNRALSNKEIYTNFTASRGRFGI